MSLRMEQTANLYFKRMPAVLICQDTIREIGPYEDLHRRYPQEDVAGDGTQILMPGLIDAHTHGAGLSYVQRGVTLDYLENALLKFATAFQLQPETTAMLNAVRHIQNGCTTLHHNESGAALDPHLKETCARKIEGYQTTGIRLGFSPGVRNKNVLAYDDREFLKTLPPDLRQGGRAHGIYRSGGGRSMSIWRPLRIYIRSIIAQRPGSFLGQIGSRGLRMSS